MGFSVNSMPWVVHKFGGTSVRDRSAIGRVAEIIADRTDGNRLGIVVSAAAGVTDALIALLSTAKQGGSYDAAIEHLCARHANLLGELFADPTAIAHALHTALVRDSDDIRAVLRSVALGCDYSDATVDLVSGYGEIWMARMLAAFLAAKGLDVAFLNARDVLFVDHGETGAVVDWETSSRALSTLLASFSAKHVVITGYVASVASDTGPIPTTLKRNGSDFSAAIFGKLLKAKEITIWTDVDGVYSADPRQVPEAVVLEKLSYNEAIELAYFGAKVLHPHTMVPAIEHDIPIWIRNTFNSRATGTYIGRYDRGNEDDRTVTGFSTVKGLALLNLEGTGMMGVPGTASRLFSALRHFGISVVLISQASSEHSICFAVPEAQAGRAKEAVLDAFTREIASGLIHGVRVDERVAVVAAVGDAMASRPGVAAKFFRALGQAGINVRAVAQGSSERNISAVIAIEDAPRALRAVHAGFYLSQQCLSVGLIGPGAIGSTLLKQLHQQAGMLKSLCNVEIRVRAIADSKKVSCVDAGHNLETWSECMDREGRGYELANFVDCVKSDYIPHALILDCSASDVVAKHYPQWLSKGAHIITPNKKAFGGELNLYHAIKKAERHYHARVYNEATVGAGLPVISTLRDLVLTGDTVVKIEGVMSGTLSYIFNAFDGDRPFSDVLREAKHLGYTEPDPRDDLSGMDVARKLLILAREIGLSLEITDVSVENLVPPNLLALPTKETFMNSVAAFDAPMAERLAEAKRSQAVLRYVGTVDATTGKASVALMPLPMSHPFAHLNGSQNIFAFTTQRYDKVPLVVQGPGAGPDVTAGGVFSDILRLASQLGA